MGSRWTHNASSTRYGGAPSASSPRARPPLEPSPLRCRLGRVDAIGSCGPEHHAAAAPPMQVPLVTGANPFAVLSFIVAPAILTNASSLLAMSTSNRLARAVDRERELTKQLEGSGDPGAAETDRRLRQLSSAEQRALMLIQALRSFYEALGG